MPPRSIVVNADTPGPSLSFALPPGVTIDVESVLAAVDASAAGDTTALLTIADSSGAVIARKRQTEVIDAGTSPGSATWALRLADDTGGGGAKPSLVGNYTAATQVIPTGNTTRFSFAHTDGANLLDLTFPDFPSYIAAGTYIIRAFMYAPFAPAFPNKVGCGTLFQGVFGATGTNMASTNIPLDLALGNARVTVGTPQIAAAGTRIIAAYEHNAGVNVTMSCEMQVVKIG